MHIITDVNSRILDQPNPEECWLWCDQCNRFFQYKSVASMCGERAACPFEDCESSGLGMNLFIWDDMREEEDPRWPRSVSELSHGARSPDMEVFYEDQLRKRIQLLTKKFSDSTEWQEYADKEPARYIEAFLKMSSDLSWDLSAGTDGTSFSEDSACELLDQLPVWSQTADLQEVPRMLAELRCFFGFAERTRSVIHASSWRTLVASEDIADLFEYTMQHDPRLRKPKRQGSEANLI